MRKNLLRAISYSNPIVGLRSQMTHTDSGDLNVDISGLDIEDGDIGIIMFSSVAADANVIVTDWTELEREDSHHWLFAKTMDGTETSIVTTLGGSMTYVVASVQIWDGVVMPDGTDSTEVSGRNPVSIAGDTSDFFAVSMYANHAASAACGITAGPSGYTDIHNTNVSTGSGDNNIWASYKEVTASDNPLAFTASGSPTDEWCMGVALDKV